MLILQPSCDKYKAFDSLDHQLLSQRLNECGLSRTEINWFMSYLSDCFQWVKYINSYLSLLFLVYINGMSFQIVHGRLLQYTDDTALIYVLAHV